VLLGLLPREEEEQNMHSHLQPKHGSDDRTDDRTLVLRLY
jgi:hypothetical protein